MRLFLRFSNIVLDIWLMNSLGGNPFFCESQGRTTELSSDGIYYCLELPGKMEERRSSSRENKMQITQTKVTFSFGKNNTEMREGPLITKEKWGNNGNFDCKRKEINLKLPGSKALRPLLVLMILLCYYCLDLLTSCLQVVNVILTRRMISVRKEVL